MNQAKTLASIVFAGLIAAGCSSNAPKAAGADEYNAARASAVASLDKADKVGYEWRDSRKILDEADKAAKAGDYEQATKLAGKAMRQGELAVEQAADQANAGKKI